MTNEQLQMIGISEAAFSAATEEQRIEWGKQNMVCLAGLCKPAAAWLKERKAKVSNVKATGVIAEMGLTYRLDPDYQPPVKRWWFDTITKTIIKDGQTVDQNALEVTAEYAALIEKKPECECELRKVRKGDVYYSYAGDWFTAGFDDEIGNDEYRWCKPRKVAGWVKYEIKAINGLYCVIGINGGNYRLDKAANRVGFGGVQFEGLGAWYMTTRKLKDSHGVLFDIELYYDDRVPAVPVRCRFWEVPKDSEK